MLSWYSITIAIGVLFVPFTVLIVAYLIWSTKKLMTRVDKKWENVRISGSSDRVTAVRVPGMGKMLELKIGGTVSSTSSVHPTKETWLNIQASNEMPSNGTERTTMVDLQAMFDEQQQLPTHLKTTDNKHRLKRGEQRLSQA